jgi:hypothetical protein
VVNRETLRFKKQIMKIEQQRMKQTDGYNEMLEVKQLIEKHTKPRTTLTFLHVTYAGLP